jgi:hypothetical protein
MRVMRQGAVVGCDVCERRVLMGEEVQAFRDGHALRHVCALCEHEAIRRGWLRDGAPLPPPTVRERRPSLLDRLRGIGARPPLAAEAAPERPAPVTHSVTPLTGRDERMRKRREQITEERSQAAVEAIVASVDAFNASSYRRTVQGIAKSLGRPRVSVLPLGGTRPDVVVTVAWDLSWYQYRVDPVADAPVRLEGRGDDVDELGARWQEWNATTADDGALVLTAAG